MCRECLGECAEAAAEARRARSTEPIAEDAAAAARSGDRLWQVTGGVRELDVVPHCVCMCVWADRERRRGIGHRDVQVHDAKSSRREKCECAVAVLVEKVPKGDTATPRERRQARIRALSSILQPDAS